MHRIVITQCRTLPGKMDSLVRLLADCLWGIRKQLSLLMVGTAHPLLRWILIYI